MRLSSAIFPRVQWWQMLALVGFLPGIGVASLQWETKLIEINAPPSEKTVTGIFRFVNSGTTTVSIDSVESSCGCTTTELAKKTYAPQEAGEIKAVFTIGDRVGRQEKSIQVVTQDAPTIPTTLLLRVTIPEVLSYSARLLLWSTGEVLAEKSLEVICHAPQKIAALEVSPSSPAGPVIRIEPIETGKKYRIVVKPASLAGQINLHLTFIAKFTNGAAQEFPVYVMVRNP